MPCFTNSQPRQPSRSLSRPAVSAWLRGWCVLCMALLLVLGQARVHAQANAAHIQNMQLDRNDEGVFLSATVKFELPALVEDALLKGIPLFFVAETEILRSRWYWYDEKVATSARHARLAYQPLTRRWRLNLSPTPITSGGLGVTLGQTYDDLDDALAALQRFSRWKIADASAVGTGSSYMVDFGFRLDTSQLPRPLQIGMAGRADWNLSASQRMPLSAEGAR